MSRRQTAIHPEPAWQQTPPLLRLLEYVLPAALLPAAVGLGWQQGDRLRRTLLQFRAALHASREQLDATMTRAPIGIVQADLDGRIKHANACYCGLVGHGPSHLRSLTLHDLTHPDDRLEHLEQHAQMLATGEPFRLESRLVRADESDVWVVSHLTMTRDVDGRPMHLIAAVQDVSHRRAAEAAVQELTETIEQRVADEVSERMAAQEGFWQAQRMEALGQLAGGVAHDFNNVLQAIAGGARMIQRRPDNAVAVERLAALVVDAAERGALVTQRLLSFARNGPLQPGPIDVAALLGDLRDILASSLGSRISVQVAIPASLPPVLADRAQLETILVNLATNARDAIMDGEPPGEASGASDVLTLSAAAVDGVAAGLPAGGFVRIDVIDSGPGMAAKILERATEPFFSTKARGRGTGLGLSVARGFAEQSGGKLTLHSTAGQGTTASIYLPQAENAAKAATSSPTPAAAAKSHILLVDDEAEIVEALSDVLVSYGYVVVTFGDAAAALLHLNKAVPADLLITDLSMPGADGLALIREAQQQRPGLPAILMTGRNGEELAFATANMTDGRLALLQKPVRLSELTGQVAAMLADTPPPT